MILLHGMAGTAADWAPVLENLDHAPAAYALDLPGHGHSPTPASSPADPFADIAHALARLVSLLGHDRAHWIGYSLGARILLGLAVHEPDVIETLTLESAHAGFTDERDRDHRKRQDEADADLVQQQGVDAFLQRWHTRSAFRHRVGKPGWPREVARKRATNTAPGLAYALRAWGLGAQPPFLARIGHIRRPTLVVAGARDEEYARQARMLHTNLPLSTLQIVDGRGHGVHVEDPKTFALLLAGQLHRPRSVAKQAGD